MILKNENIICISSIDWDFLWQGHQEIMTRFAKAGNRVLYIENTGVRAPKIRDASRVISRIKNWRKGLGGFREVDKNIFVFSPIVLPFPYSKIAQALNSFNMLRLIKSWMESASFHDPVVWTFLPTVLTINIIKQLKSKLVIYYCIDSFVDSSDGAKRIVKSENELFGLADMVFGTSHNLMNKAKKFNDDVHFFPFAVDMEGFLANRERALSEKIPKVIKGLKKPIIGYIGGIHKWLDMKLIKDAAIVNPQWTFVMIGPVQTDISDLKPVGNIIFPGRAAHNDLPRYIENFDVCIIPYLVTDYTQNVYPTKLTEYLAIGKPVVSTPIVELEMFDKKNPNIVKLAGNSESFINAISESINDNNHKLMNERIEKAKENTWDGHLRTMSTLIEDRISKKEKTKISWQEQFKDFYFQKKSVLPKYILYFILLWITIFHTPIIWYLGDSLVLVDKVRKADAVISYGGGVGESGLAGEGYVERAEKVIEIYSNNMAGNVVFMSGYTYMMKETEMMKAFAIQYGILNESISLESDLISTYSYVLKSVEIAKRKGWKTIMVVSSPYHMLRVKLCFSKLASDVKVLYVPVNHSAYYSWPKKRPFVSFGRQITVQQISGLIHEVLGIVYYKFKGYI